MTYRRSAFSLKMVEPIVIDDGVAELTLDKFLEDYAHENQVDLPGRVTPLVASYAKRAHGRDEATS